MVLGDNNKFNPPPQKPRACIYPLIVLNLLKLIGDLIVGYLEEMLLRNGVIYRSSDGFSSYIEGSLLSNTLVIRNSSGYVTHKIERSANGVDIIVRNTSTGLVEMRLTN